jgi:drug/metabolite transporter (DMT)-like permease
MATITSSVSSTTIPERVDPRVVFSLFSVYVIWGSTYLVMAIAVVDLPPFLMAAIRFVIAGVVMFALARRRGVPFPPLREWLGIAPVGALLFLGGNGFVAIAERTVTSGGAAVVCATMPLWVGVLGSVINKADRPTLREWISLVIGFAGVLVLLGGPSLAGDTIDVLAILAAPISWALGSVLARRLPATPTPGDAFMLPAIQMLTGGAALALVGAASGERIPVDAPATAWLALLYLLVFGSLVGFTAYSWLLRNTRAAVATSYAYVNPILAVVIGAWLSGEPLGVTTVIANAMIVAAVMLALRNGAKR